MKNDGSGYFLLAFVLGMIMGELSELTTEESDTILRKRLEKLRDKSIEFVDKVLYEAN